MRKLKLAIAKTPILGRFFLICVRAKAALSYFLGPLSYLVKWLFKSKETTNYTYDLEETNKRYLASLIADITGTSADDVSAYFKEIEEDEELKEHIVDSTKKSEWAFLADTKVRYGRRIGWYALVRIMKPGIVFETGVDKGLGACVLSSALKKNKEEGFEGRYYGTDINSSAGYLLSGDYKEHGIILYGDSIESLKKFDGLIDLFINDSDHSAAYEFEEYKTITKKLSSRAIILGDNAHCTNKLLEYSLETKRNFIFFQERPAAHWYPGAGIGISFKRLQATCQSLADDAMIHRV